MFEINFIVARFPAAINAADLEPYRFLFSPHPRLNKPRPSPPCLSSSVIVQEIIRCGVIGRSWERSMITGCIRDAPGTPTGNAASSNVIHNPDRSRAPLHLPPPPLHRNFTISPRAYPLPERMRDACKIHTA